MGSRLLGCLVPRLRRQKVGKDGLDTPGGREREQWGASIKHGTVQKCFHLYKNVYIIFFFCLNFK